MYKKLENLTHKLVENKSGHPKCYCLCGSVVSPSSIFQDSEMSPQATVSRLSFVRSHYCYQLCSF